MTKNRYNIKAILFFLLFICSIIILKLLFTTGSKVKTSKKVVFIAHTRTVGGKGILEIYEEMKKQGHDVKIVMIPLFYSGKKLTEGMDLEFAKQFDKDDVVFPCGKAEPYKCSSIENLNPDYIFTQMPYNPYDESPLYPYFSNDYLKKISKKLMLIVYGPHIFHQLGMNNTELPKLVDVIFVDSEVSKKIYIEGFNFKKENVVVSGYQPYKSIRDKLNENIDKKEPTDHKETVLWLPRWQLSFKDRELYEGGSTFLSYHYYFYNYFKENPNINFIIRPHFGLFLLRGKFLTQNDLMSILNKFKTLSNVSISYHQDSSLTEDIMKSDFVISDGSSALAEVIIADKPIIYLSNGWNNEFNSNPLSKELKKQIYIAYDPLDIEKYTEIIRNNNYKVKYDKNFKEMLDPVENPAKFIADYISYLQ